LLPWLAWALSVDSWNADWPEAIKRVVIAESVVVHRHKGTIGALRRAIGALGHGIQVSEWHQYNGQVYRFRLDVELTDRGLTDAEQLEILLTAEQTKNARSWLESLTIYLTSRGKFHYAAAIQSGDECTVYPYAITELEQHTSIPVIALGTYGVETTTIYPR
jgi:phage tail P2-like protein